MLYAVIEARHADVGPIYDNRDEAEAALREIRHNAPWEAENYEVVELEDDGALAKRVEERATRPSIRR